MKLPKIYEPAQYEDMIYALWEKSGAFAPTTSGKENYSIVMPPPNANGNLHLGHALTVAVQDTLIRYHRMRGYNTLYLPGADHAGFETWVVFEKKLNEQGKTRFDFSREELYEQVWKFVEDHKGNMLEQTRKLGASADWSRFTYTLDEKVVKTTYSTFKRLWDDKRIYRGERLVNYCTTHHTGFADIEVDYVEQKTPLYYMKYGPFTLATTRPETKFGDTAVAVHPDDKRYSKYVGKVIEVEGLEGKFELQVIADKMVDPEFGTGAVKITPAHDQNDWEAAQRHNLPAVRVINHNGTMNHKAGRFKGMTVLEARKAVVEALKEKGLLVKIDEDYTNRVGVCYKCGTTIEPMLMKQWFVDMKPLAAIAKKAIENDEIKFYPQSKKGVVLRYLNEIRDWNISRQIAWGVPIPAFQNINDEDDWVYNENVTDEIMHLDGQTYKRDADVFDTWFSSGQWPFITMGYPDGDDYKNFYPLSVMETGYDILIQWVTRMIMLGLYTTGEVPFKDVYLHGLVLDKEGQKMSKSKGNVINPIDILDKYGSDALRMGLLRGRSAGMNQAFTEDRVVGARNFANKLWNVARYVESVLGDDYVHARSAKPETSADHWILDRIKTELANNSNLIESYRLAEAYEAVYHLLWNDIADWYLEVSKKHLNKDVLAYVLESILRLAHPMAPFVTETIWDTLEWEESLLINTGFPEPVKHNVKSADEFEKVRLLVSEVRYLTSRLGLRQNTLYHSGDKFIEKNQELIVSLSNLAGASSVDSGYGLHLTSIDVDAWIDVEKDIIHDYYNGLVEQQKKLELQLKALEKRLKNKAYVDGAPKKLVDETKAQKTEVEEALVRISKQADSIEETLRKI